ncbi:MAG TPA: uroporphyrinogen decarboxylase family protein [Negativicutes bacterium]
MSKNINELFNERLGRYQAVMALEPTDRVSIAPGSNDFAGTYGGRPYQEAIYKQPNQWCDSVEAFMKDFPEVDVVRPLRIWGPIYDVLDCTLYKLSGRDLSPDIEYQFVEKENMKADEYDAFINDPLMFTVERYLPRVFAETQKGSGRSHVAYLKAGIAYMLNREYSKQKGDFAEHVLGTPIAMKGALNAPFDFVGNAFRGLNGILMDTFRQPDKVTEACEVVVPLMVKLALAGADPQRRYPIQAPLHKGIFLSPKQFERFYWPTLKKCLNMLIDQGYTVRALLEGNWEPYWHHFLELPKGKVVCDIDDQADIFKAKQEIGHHQCIAGGLPSSMLILGTPEDVKQRVKLLCQTVGKDGGYIINGGCRMPRGTKPENFRALVDAVMEYGRYSETCKPTPKKAEFSPLIPGALINILSWEAKKAEIGGVLGDEDLIRKPWETIDQIALGFILSMTM